MLNLNDVQSKIQDAFLDLEFEEGRHLYKVKNKLLTSTTAMIKQHTPEFNEKEVAGNVARKLQVKTNEVLLEWKNKREKAAYQGTKVHLFAENYIVDNELVPTCRQEEAVKKFIHENILSGKYTVLITELKMYSEKYGYAGTSDLLLWDNELEEIVIADYKTNYDLDKQYGYLLEPFSYTPNTPYCKYQIQLSYYQILLEEIQLYAKQRVIIWLKTDGTYELRNCNDFTTILKDYLQQC